MTIIENSKDLVSEFIWSTDCVSISTKNQFTLTSGELSPIYFDCRNLISKPSAMSIIAELWIESLRQIYFNYIYVEYCIGGESAGIPFAQMLALLSGKKFAYVRKSSRGHGLKNDIVGLSSSASYHGTIAILVEDMITDGASKISFIQKIRANSLRCSYCLTVLDRQQGGSALLHGINANLLTLVTASEVLEYGLKNEYISKSDFKIVTKYLHANA